MAGLKQLWPGLEYGIVDSFRTTITDPYYGFYHCVTVAYPRLWYHRIYLYHYGIVMEVLWEGYHISLCVITVYRMKDISHTVYRFINPFFINCYHHHHHHCHHLHHHHYHHHWSFWYYIIPPWAILNLSLRTPSKARSATTCHARSTMTGEAKSTARCEARSTTTTLLPVKPDLKPYASSLRV